MPVVRIFHEQTGDKSPFNPSSGHVRPLDGVIDFEADHEIRKQRHSALVGTDLHGWLKAHGIGRLVVSGIRTEQCCETTTRHASDEGFEVDFVLEATLTFDMEHSNGSKFTASDIRQRTATVLSDRFATIVGVDEAVSRASIANVSA